MADKYNLKIPQDLADFFQNYLDEHKELGFTFVSKFLLHVLQNEAKRLMEEKTEEKKVTQKMIALPEGKYSEKKLRELLESLEKEE